MRAVSARGCSMVLILPTPTFLLMRSARENTFKGIYTPPLLFLALGSQKLLSGPQKDASATPHSIRKQQLRAFLRICF